ncbi:hypothetical protein KC571_02120 [candidate division WWE3 bacterium]|uniref:Uncharacterized protein n=1 Tax=candidate division WWE3 bacterium TaxID=2053526 RepID=A0A955RQ64_UNCKA|nr:hypothetical protein [candidate division WWE3 bacterium]
MRRFYSFYYSFPKISTVILSVLIATIALVIWRINTPLGNFLGWDMYAHQHLFNELLRGHWAILPTNISDTFLINAYFPLFAIIVGLGKLTVPFLSFPIYYDFLDIFYFFATIGVSLLLVRTVRKDLLSSLVIVIFSAFTFEAVVAQTAFFFIPQNLAALLVVLLLIWWLKNRRTMSLLLLFPIMMLHFVIGGFGWAVLFLTWMIQLAIIFFEKRKHSIKLLLISAFTIWLFAFGISFFLSLNPLGTNESVTFTFGLAEKYAYLLKSYSYLWLFYFIGIFSILKGYKHKYNHEIIIAILSVFLVTAVILPLPYSLKFYTVARYPVHVVMTIGVVYLLRQIQNKRYQVFILALLILTESTILFYNQSEFKKAIAYKYSYATISDLEYEAARYLQLAYPKDNSSVLLVSDPSTQHILEATGGINSQGGGFAVSATRTIVNSAYPLTDSQKLRSELWNVRDLVYPEQPSIVLFVVSGRFMSWQNVDDKFKYDEGYNIWSPKELNQLGINYILELEEQEGFNTVFENSAVVIFEVARPQ